MAQGKTLVGSHMNFLEAQRTGKLYTDAALCLQVRYV